MKINYRDYRSTFLIIWLIANIVVGFVAVTISRNSQILYLMVIAAFLLVIIVIKLVFSTLHIFKAWKDRFYVHRYLKTKEGKIFNPEKTNMYKPQFTVYKDEEDREVESYEDSQYYSSQSIIQSIGGRMGRKYHSNKSLHGGKTP